MRCLSLLISGLMLISLTTVSFAQTPPQTMSYQGLLTDEMGVPVPDGSYDLTFRLYLEPTPPGPALWTENRPGIQVAGGRFSVILGEVNPLDVSFDRQYYLGIAVGGASELSPRVKLASAPSALMAADIVDNSITTAKIASSAVTSAKVSNNSLTHHDLLDEAGVVYDEGQQGNILNIEPENLEWEIFDIPAPGYVIAFGSAHMRIRHEGDNVEHISYTGYVSLSTTNRTHDNSNRRMVSLPPRPELNSASSFYRFDITVMDVFEFNSAVRDTMFLVGSGSFAEPSNTIYSPDHSMLLIYVPRAYGYVNPLAGQGEGLESD